MSSPIAIFPPRKDADLLNWSSNWSAKISASPSSFSLDAGQCALYAALHASYASAFAAANNANTNSRAIVNSKNSARRELLYGAGGAWELVNIVQAFPGTSNDMRGQLGLRILDTGAAPVGPPQSPPKLSIISTVGRTVKVRLRDRDNPDRRGKPDGVDGAIVLYVAGDAMPPNDPSAWTFCKITARTLFDVTIPISVPARSNVWLSAFWFNKRKEAGPTCSFASTTIGQQLGQVA